ncbi:MAG: YeeE/YedE thiosulfate transporter family protein [Pseudomonadota bacterium]
MNFTNSLALALLIGAAFGACLEAAGLGNATKLAGQFTLRDFTVLKVMFSAIVTAMLGTFWLGRLGVIALGALYVPDTFLLPQLLGGLVFGVGFVLSGLCPGTACVAAASGKVDALAAIGGLLAGVLLAGLAMPALLGWYRANAHGVYTLPTALGMPYGAVVAAVVVMAVALFAVIERWEHAS